MLLFLNGLGYYFSVGVVFAAWFAIVGAQKMDSVASGAGLRFRLLLIPGAAALWPILLFAILRSRGTSAVAEDNGGSK